MFQIGGRLHRSTVLIGCLAILVSPASLVAQAANDATAVAVKASARVNAEPRGVQVVFVLIDFEGEVLVQEQTGPSLRPEPPQLLANDARLEIPPGASVDLLCPGGRLLRLSESGRVTARLCGAGSDGARDAGLPIRRVFGDPVIEAQVRSDDLPFGQTPVVLFPRCPIEFFVNSPCDLLPAVPPVLQWTAVQGARDYKLELLGPEPLDELDLTAEEVECQETAGLDGHRVCRLPWPDAWSLQPGMTYFLRVASQAELAWDWTWSEGQKLTLAQPAQAQPVLAVLGQLDQEQGLTRAALLDRAGFVTSAILELERFLAEHQLPVGRLILGDLYRRVDLRELAVFIYQVAANEATELGQPEVAQAALAARREVLEDLRAIVSTVPHAR